MAYDLGHFNVTTEEAVRDTSVVVVLCFTFTTSDVRVCVEDYC